MPPMGHPLTKMKSHLIEKQTLLIGKPPSRKRFPEKKQIITENLAKILEKYKWRSSFLINLQTCRLLAGNFTNIWTPSQIVFNSILTPKPSPSCIYLNPHPPPPCSQHLWETLGYLPIGEMGNFAGTGIFMRWWESEEEWFWPFKPFLKLENNIL